MKFHLALFVVVAMIFASCSKSNYTSEVAVNDIPDTSMAKVLYSAGFEDGPFGHVTGTVELLEDSISHQFSLALVNFNTSNGPDLHVYLSQESHPIHFIELGRLKSTSGDQVYQIKGNPDFKKYSYALIHCEKFNHVFGVAQLR